MARDFIVEITRDIQKIIHERRHLFDSRPEQVEDPELVAKRKHRIILLDELGIIDALKNRWPDLNSDSSLARVLRQILEDNNTSVLTTELQKLRKDPNGYKEPSKDQIQGLMIQLGLTEQK